MVYIPIQDDGILNAARCPEADALPLSYPIVLKRTRTNDALVEAGRRRLRPILMTTLTTIFGLLPLAYGIGEGADAQAPLARAVVGGLTGSAMITLVLIPAVYSLFHSDIVRPQV